MFLKWFLVEYGGYGASIRWSGLSDLLCQAPHFRSKALMDDAPANGTGLDVNLETSLQAT